MEIDHSIPGDGSVTNDGRYKELGSLIYSSYVAHELLCLYVEISLWCKQGENVLRTLSSFEGYLGKVTDNATPPCESSPDVHLFHAKIEDLAMKLREAGLVGRI